jgi:hypothetical protein
MGDSDPCDDVTVERGARRVTPSTISSRAHPAKVLWRRLLGYGPPSRPRRPVPPLRMVPDGSEQATTVVTPMRILR